MKDNKLLAEYIGKDVKEFTWNNWDILISAHVDPILEGIDYTHIWQPESNWNQLMMVVEKILEELYLLSEYYEGLADALQKANIEAVYNACVEYISYISTK